MPRVLHLGLGNFHRAHQAWHTVRTAGWKITGVVMGNEALYETMKSQHGAYHLGIRGANEFQIHRIAVHDRLLLARKDPHAVVAAIADPKVQIITLTITEKGYYLDPDGRLNLSSPSIAQDLAQYPRSAIGMLAHGLAMRTAPVTVISCDNISGNGHKLRTAVADFARAAGLRFTSDIRFPNTMVDRITPATTDSIRSEIEAAGGIVDQVPVLTEAFSEWIIEDDFAGLRPPWETAGVEIVPNVMPYEMRKLRLLNAAHSYLAYAGLIAGHRFVHEAIADASMRARVELLWDEAQATLPDSIEASIPAYRAALIERFAVVEMRHELAQIAGDGSLKLRERILPIVAGSPDAPQARETLAAWIAFVIDSRHRDQVLRDVNSVRIASLFDEASDTNALCKSLTNLLGLTQFSAAWGDALTSDVTRLGRHYNRIT